MTNEKSELEKIEGEFILSHDAEKEDYAKLIRRMMKYAKVDQEGYVIIDETAKDVPMKDKILLILTTRYLANKLQEKLGKENAIKGEMSADDLEHIMRAKKDVIQARIKELRDDNKVKSEKAGIYSIAPHYLKTFLDTLDKNNQSNNHL